MMLDAGAAAAAVGSSYADLLAAPSLDPLLTAGPEVWADVRASLTQWLNDDSLRAQVHPQLRPRDDRELLLPFPVADYVDFYASEHHARNLGRLLRPGEPPLMPNYKHLPVGYHGRAGTIVVSGTDVRRRCGQRGTGDGPEFGPSQRLDIEAEVGFVVGAPSTPGEPV